MASYQIVCTEQVPHYLSSAHARIVAVGIQNGGQTERLTVEQVIAAMDRGHYFYTVGEHSGKKIYVEQYYCSDCGRTHIRTRPDDFLDNNLDSIDRCN